MASVRLLVKQLLDDAAMSRGTTRHGVFESEKSFDVAKGQLQTDKGIGEKLISKILRDMPGMTENNIRGSLKRLKASGDYARNIRAIAGDSTSNSIHNTLADNR